MEMAFMILVVALAASFVVTSYLISVIDHYSNYVKKMCENCPIRKELEAQKEHDG